MKILQIKETRGITLIALVITIIILLILAGITIITLTGENGLLNRSKTAGERNKYTTAEEKVKLAVMSSIGTNGSINDDLLKENINSIEGLNKKVNEINYDLTIKVDGYEFKISSLGKVTSTGQAVGKLPENTPTTNAGTEVALKDSWETETMKYIKTANGEEEKEVTKVSTVYAISAGNGESVPVPYGFYYVGGTIDSGVVISDNEADKNKYAGKEDVGKDLEGNQFVWIPSSVENYKKREWGYTLCSYDNRTNNAEEVQIQKYGGFYVGRYEAGTSEVTLTNGKKIGDEIITSLSNECYTIKNVTQESKPTTKANEIPYCYLDAITSEAMAKRMYNTNYVSSGLITGTEWDVMIDFMSGETDKNISNAGNSSKYVDLKLNSTWGNYNNTTLSNCEGKYCITDANGAMLSNWQENKNKTNRDSTYILLTTGATEEVKKKNLYDVAGNLWECVQETADGTSTSYRGGAYYGMYSYYPVCIRANDAVTSTHMSHDFRPVLYIK